MHFDPTEHPHRRFNPLTGQYVLVSPHRTKRPWQGKKETPAAGQRPPYDPACYLCPGNPRAAGDKNPAYESTYVFTNDFAALLGDAPAAPAPAHPLLQVETQRGECRVICFSPRHDLTLAEMEPAEIAGVIGVWADQIKELGQRWRWVQVFENKGALMGCSNPHPHGQIWASDLLPNEPAAEDTHQEKYLKEHGRPLLLDYAALEAEKGERIIAQNEDWLAVVPFWAVWPFEAMVLPRAAHVQRLDQLTPPMRRSLAEVMKALLVRYDNLFEVSFPYSMGWHGAPTDGQDHPAWQLHAHFYPPLLRSAQVRKFLVGYEMMAEAQRDLTAEQAAARLRDLPTVHYKQTLKNEQKGCLCHADQ